MTSVVADYRTAEELIRAHFRNQEQEWEDSHDNLRFLVWEWVYSAYLEGLEEGYNQGYDVGSDEGYDDGHSEGYDEGYEDARSEFESYD